MSNVNIHVFARSIKTERHADFFDNLAKLVRVLESAVSYGAISYFRRPDGWLTDAEKLAAAVGEPNAEALAINSLTETKLTLGKGGKPRLQLAGVLDEFHDQVESVELLDGADFRLISYPIWGGIVLNYGGHYHNRPEYDPKYSPIFAHSRAKVLPEGFLEVYRNNDYQYCKLSLRMPRTAPIGHVALIQGIVSCLRDVTVVIEDLPDNVEVLCQDGDGFTACRHGASLGEHVEVVRRYLIDNPRK